MKYINLIRIFFSKEGKHIILFTLVLSILVGFINYKTNISNERENYKSAIQIIDKVYLNKLSLDFEKLVLLLETIKNNQDDETIKNSNIIFNFFLIKNKSYQDNLIVEINDDYNQPCINLKKGMFSAVIKLKDLKSLLVRTLPEYFTYSILLNNNSAFVEKDNIFFIKRLINNKLDIKFSLDEHYTSNKNKEIIFNSIIFALTVCFVLTLLLIFIMYYLSVRQNKLLINDLIDISFQLEKEKRTAEEYEKLYLSKNISDSSNYKIFNIFLKRLLLKNYDAIELKNKNDILISENLNELKLLEKLNFIKEEPSFHNIKEVVEEVSNYYNHYLILNKIKLEVEIEKENVQLPISREGFLQFILSILYNRLNCLLNENQSYIKILFKYNAKYLSIQFIDNGFNIDINKVDNYRYNNPISRNYFIMSWDNLTKALDVFNVKTKSERINKENHTTINFYFSKKSKKILDQNICYINDYKN